MTTAIRTMVSRLLLASVLAACSDRGVVTTYGADPPLEDAAVVDPVLADAGPAKVPDDAGAAVAPQAVRVVVKPNGQGDAEVVDAIRSATRSVRLFIYLLTDDDVINALVARARAGVDVRVVLNRTFPANSSDMQPTFDRLVAGRVKVVWAPAAFAFMHAKTLIVDDRLAWIMTMNLTVAGSTGNREYLVEDKEPIDVAQAVALFDSDYANRASSPSDALTVAPVNARRALGDLIAGATRSIDLEGETFSDDRLTNALIDAKRRGVAVRVVLARDTTPTPARADAVAALKNAGIPVVAFGAPTGTGSAANPYVHAKMILVDGARAYVGSANFTSNALDANREIGVVVREGASVATIARTVDADFRAGSRL